MARITITIEDAPEGKVKVVAEPSFEMMCRMENSGEHLTSAHGYAFLALNAIRTESKNLEPSTKIYIPRIGL